MKEGSRSPKSAHLEIRALRQGGPGPPSPHSVSVSRRYHRKTLPSQSARFFTSLDCLCTRVLRDLSILALLHGTTQCWPGHSTRPLHTWRLQAYTG